MYPSDLRPSTTNKYKTSLDINYGLTQIKKLNNGKGYRKFRKAIFKILNY